MTTDQLVVVCVLGSVAGVIEPRAGFITFGVAIILFLVGG